MKPSTTALGHNEQHSGAIKNMFLVTSFAFFSAALAAETDYFVQPLLPQSVSTIPSNGDLNPYGVAFVPEEFSHVESVLLPGDILVSNFNNSDNLQGTGTTIVRIAEDNSVTTFFTTPSPSLGGSGTGLTTALAILKKGYILVGSLPSSDGTIATASPGSILVIDGDGNFITAITNIAINGPWDMTVHEHEDRIHVFVSSVLSGTVVRFELSIHDQTVTARNFTIIGSGYAHSGNESAFVLGPTGLVYDHRHDKLYVASTQDNAIYSIRDAKNRHYSDGTGHLIFNDTTYLHGPLGLIMAPNGHLLVSNGDAVNADANAPSEIIELTKEGLFISQMSIDTLPGAAFGMDIRNRPHSTTFAAVDDNASALLLYKFAPTPGGV